MKLTKTKLKQIIKEEIEQIVQEDDSTYKGIGAQTDNSHTFGTALNNALVILQRMEKVLRKIEFNTKSATPTGRLVPDPSDGNEIQ